MRLKSRRTSRCTELVFSGRPSRRRSKCRSPAVNSMSAQLGLLADEVPGGLYVAADENAERDL